MKQKVIGNYYMGNDQVELVLREGTGGEFYKGHIPRIKVGADCEKWKDVMSVLLHEAFEFALARKPDRDFPQEDMGSESSGFTFMFPHVDFSDMCVTVAEYICFCQNDLCKAWKKWQKVKK